jgi:maltose alpha-D-glucosyltransferase/alpha-amylase
VEYQNQDGTVMTLALLQAFVMNQGDGWDYTVNYLVRFLEDRRTGTPLPEDAHGLYLALMRTLAIRTAELHVALSRPTDNPAFAPEPITETDIQSWRAHALAEAEKTFAQLSDQLARLPPEVATDAESLLKRRALLLRRIEASAARVPKGLKTRRHGDYHLGQVLVRRNDFILVDFEGEPGRSLAERRLKHSPLTDVAGMLRSFAYARRAALQRSSQAGTDHVDQLDALLEKWEQQTRRTFIAAYDDVACTNGLYASMQEMRPLLQLFEIVKALYEVRYELGNRPDWTSIPLRALIAFAE